MPRNLPTILQYPERIHLAALLGVKLPTLTYYAYGSGKRYRQFDIAKKSGSARTISAPVGGLGNIQKKLALLLTEVYKPHPAAHGFIPTRSILSNASPHLNKKCVLNIDLSDFFPSITATRIIGLLKSDHFGMSNETASTIAALCTYNDLLPQGAVTSPIISNMICYRLDRELTALCKKERITYTRYADDITFSTTRQGFSKSFINLVTDNSVVLSDYLIAIIESNYFKINQDKVRLHSGTKAKFVTGVKVNLKPNLSRRYVREVRSMIHSWEHFGLEGAQAEFESKYNGGSRSFQNVVLGKVAHLRQIKGQDDLAYRRLYNRVLVLQGKYDEILPTSEIEDLLQRIFVIKSGAQFGTGFILDRKWLITCAHVIDAEEVSFFRYDRARLPDEYHTTQKNDRLVSPIKEFDIAAFPIDDNIINDFNVFVSAPATVEVKTGDWCKVVGFPEYYLGSMPSVVDVKVSKVELNRYGIYDAHVDRTLVSGNSGGPVLNLNNEVIGLVRTGAPDSDNIQGFGSTFLPIQEIRKCLSQFESSTP